MISSCRGNSDKIPMIDLTSAIHKKIMVSEFFESVEYIKLETSPECLLGDDLHVFFSEEYIITSWFKENVVYLFNRKNGDFIKQVSRRGQGSGEYSLAMIGAFDIKNKILYFNKKNYWMGVNIETNEIKNIAKPDLPKEEFIPLPVSGFSILDDNLLISFVNNVSGVDTIKLVIFDQNGNILKTYPNYQKYTNESPATPYSMGTFYQYNNLLFFKESEFNDTVFRVSYDSIIPQYTVFLGDKQPPYHLRESPDFDIQNYFSLNLIGECERFVFFSFFFKTKLHCGYYDKAESKTFICNNNKMKNGFIIENEEMPDFVPIGMTNDGKLYGIVSAEVITSAISDNASLKTKPELNHLLNMKNDDNPIIIIAKPKQ